MSGTPDIHGLARQQAVLEERMNTMQAEYETALERFGRQTDTALERLRTDQQASLRQHLVAVIGIVALGFAGLGFFLTQRQPAVVMPPAPAPVIIQTAPAAVPAEVPEAPATPAAEPQPDS